MLSTGRLEGADGERRRDLQRKAIQGRDAGLCGDGAWRELRPRRHAHSSRSKGWLRKFCGCHRRLPEAGVSRYVRRRQVQSDPQLKRMSVGDVLPDSGVRYLGIPLRYGAPFYRCAIIGGDVVIVDPSTSRVIQVIE